MATGLQVRLALSGDLKGFAEQTHLRVAKGARAAAERLAAIAKLRLRQDVRRAGLGDRLANTWRVDVYPRASAKTHSPAVYIRSRAPEVMLAHGMDQVVRARNALWLAIPTDSVPRRGRRPVTPEQVEAIYDQDLIFIRGMGRRMLAFIDKGLRGRLKRWRRKGSSGEAPQARRNKLTLMFVMVPQVHLRKRLDWQRIFADLGKDWATIFPQEVERALAAGSN